MRIPARLIAASGLTLIALAACANKPHATSQSQQPASTTQPSTNQLATLQPASVITRPPAVNTYHGTPVVDTYQWLENWEDPAVKSWERSPERQDARSARTTCPTSPASANAPRSS